MKQSSQSGSIFYFILIAIVLIGGITLALRDSGGLDSNVDKEQNAAYARQILKYNNDLARGVQFLLQNGASETDIRFGHPNNAYTHGDITTTPQYQVFSSQGGKVSWQPIPPGAVLSGNTPYISFAGDRGFTQVGSARPELYMNAFPLTDGTCQAINTQMGYTNAVPTINCPGSWTIFTGTYSAAGSYNLDLSGFSQLPAQQVCVKCADLNNWNIYFGVILAR